MAKGTIILGNGFDLDLGLRTNYSDFAKSRYWEELMRNNPHCSDNVWLLGYLREKYNVEKWIDIESTLLEYALLKTQIKDVAHAEEDKDDFMSLCRALKYYLIEQQNCFVPARNSVAKEFLEGLYLTRGSSLYTFNYTILSALGVKMGGNPNLCFGIGRGNDAIHIHGSLADEGNLILGIDTHEEIIEEYSFLFKTQNRQYRHTDILKDLWGRDEYVFFGHSLNGMDYSYFSALFMRLSSTSTSPSRLTIITKNENEENRFKNFLRKSHISLQGLYSNSIPTFILTDDVYKQCESERAKLNELLVRVRMM